jgi:hypothetical protein
VRQFAAFGNLCQAWLDLLGALNAGLRPGAICGVVEMKMNSQMVGLRVAGTIFGLVCLAQLLRLVTRAEVFVAGYQVPLWPSAVGVVIAGGLSLWTWKLSSR